jgi:hypothetical protein
MLPGAAKEERGKGGATKRKNGSINVLNKCH